MGFDDLKGKATGALDEHSEKVDQGLDKAGDFAESKGASSEHVDKGRDFVDDQLGTKDKKNEGDKKDKN